MNVGPKIELMKWCDRMRLALNYHFNAGNKIWYRSELQVKLSIECSAEID